MTKAVANNVINDGAGTHVPGNDKDAQNIMRFAHTATMLQLKTEATPITFGMFVNGELAELAARLNFAYLDSCVASINALVERYGSEALHTDAQARTEPLAVWQAVITDHVAQLEPYRVIAEGGLPSWLREAIAKG